VNERGSSSGDVTKNVNVFREYRAGGAAHNGLVAASSPARPTNELNSLRLARQVLFEVNHRFDHRYVLLAILRRNRGCGLAHVIPDDDGRRCRAAP